MWWESLSSSPGNGDGLLSLPSLHRHRPDQDSSSSFLLHLSSGRHAPCIMAARTVVVGSSVCQGLCLSWAGNTVLIMVSSSGVLRSFVLRCPPLFRCRYSRSRCSSISCDLCVSARMHSKETFSKILISCDFYWYTPLSDQGSGGRDLVVSWCRCFMPLLLLFLARATVPGHISAFGGPGTSPIRLVSGSSRIAVEPPDQKRALALQLFRAMQRRRQGPCTGHARTTCSQGLSGLPLSLLSDRRSRRCSGRKGQGVWAVLPVAWWSTLLSLCPPVSWFGKVRLL